MASAQPISVLERNKQLVIQWFEQVWNQGNRNAISELLRDDAVIHDGPSDIRGPEGFFVYFLLSRGRVTLPVRIGPFSALSPDAGAVPPPDENRRAVVLA